MRQALFEACVEAGDSAVASGQEEYEGLRAAALWWLNTHPQVWNSPAELLRAPAAGTCTHEEAISLFRLKFLMEFRAPLICWL